MVRRWGIGLALLVLAFLGNGWWVISHDAAEALDIAWLARTCPGLTGTERQDLARDVELDRFLWDTEYIFDGRDGAFVHAVRGGHTKALCLAGVGCLLPPQGLEGCG
ncbi:hypothetical protein [Stagnihabitans tardus]|uniref:Uncharacterized protein n=1 Tax=Stagnihabitans tardus TaxID=2699202 RepID=A0AAE4Y9H9_9RHOB|nr:hypothetical protein [Stagnihabitans tardus]NBZ88456.1 hypothetical protein [Stagnihabitans tardus]